MSTNFNRNRAQLRCESFVNCTNLSDWAGYHDAFANYILNARDEANLKNDLVEDAKDFYFMGLLSLSEGINSIYKSLYSWATVKLYYSVYYLLRASFAIKGYAIVRNKSLYVLKAQSGEKPFKKGHKKYSTTHQGTINYYKDLFETTDLLQSNLIDGDNSYLWLMDRREQINYRERSFHDPGCSDFWITIDNYAKSKKIVELLKEYFHDPKFVYCFQEDHACLALPIKRCILTTDHLQRVSFRKYPPG